MKLPRQPISKEAYEHLKSKHKRMKGREKEKAIKRLETYDRGYQKKNNDVEVEYD